jgi:hypothetical protein
MRGDPTKNLQKVSDFHQIVSPATGNPHHQARKTPVVEHKGNATLLSAHWILRDAP